MTKKELASAQVRLYPPTRSRLRRRAFNAKMTLAEFVDQMEKDYKGQNIKDTKKRA